MSVMRAIRRYKWPQNEHTADLIRFVPHFRELQLSWTAGAAMSDGMEKFVEEFLLEFGLLSLHRSHVDCDPFVVGVFNWERKRKMRCCWSIEHELKILATVQQLSLGGDFRTGIRLGVTPRLPRGQELL
uniref:Uncharacterized protein n=1 Tax=Ditylenchus dipsaci TaxID=166011 RepID=A0A915EFD1_9BILA